MSGQALALNKVGGIVHSIPHLQTLSDSDCNVLFVSSRTLYVLQNLADLDTRFYTRYATEFVQNNLYIPSTETEASGVIVDGVADSISLELSPVTCDLTAVLTKIAATMASSDCGCNVGQGADSTEGELGGPIPRAVGDIDYQEPAAIASRQCKAANIIHSTLRDTLAELDSYGVDNMAILGFILALGVVVAIIGSVVTPLGGLVLAVAGGMAGFLGKLFLGGFDLGTMVAILDTERDSAICALTEATTVDEARTDYATVLATGGMTSTALELIGLLATNAVLNVLFFDTAETVGFWATYTPPYDCSSCGESCGWQFVSSLGTGDLSADGASRTLSSVPYAGGHTIQIELPSSSPCDVVNRLYQIGGLTGWTFWYSASYDSYCSNSGGGSDLIWDYSLSGDPVPTTSISATLLRVSSTTAFTMDITLFAGLTPAC